MATQVILLEKVDKLGAMGDVVSVKPGYARNFLLPQSKALRATKQNIAYFGTQKEALEKISNDQRKEAEKVAKKIAGANCALIRQASEMGQLYGSVSARDIAQVVEDNTGVQVERSQIVLNQNFKLLGLFPVEIALHPEVRAEIIINIARSDDEAALQKKTGKAVTGDDVQEAQAANDDPADDMKADLMEEDALKAEQTRDEESAVQAEEQAAKSEAKSEARAEKKAAKAEVAEEESAENSEGEETADEDGTENVAEASDDAPTAEADTEKDA